MRAITSMRKRNLRSGVFFFQGRTRRERHKGIIGRGHDLRLAQTESVVILFVIPDRNALRRMSDIRNISTRVTPGSRRECYRGSFLCEDQSFRLDTRKVYSIRPSFSSHFSQEKRNYCCSLSHGENKSLFPTLVLFIYSFIYFHLPKRAI